MFLPQVPGPVFVEVAVADEGAEFEDGFGAVHAPSGPCYAEAVGDDVPAGAFYYSGGDGPAAFQGGGVVQVGLLGGEVAGGLVGAGAFGRGVAEQAGAAADPGGDLRGLAFQDPGQLGGDPGFGVGVAGFEERPGGFPGVLELSAVSARESYVPAGHIVVAIDVTLLRR